MKSKNWLMHDLICRNCAEVQNLHSPDDLEERREFAKSVKCLNSLDAECDRPYAMIPEEDFPDDLMEEIAANGHYVWGDWWDDDGRTPVEQGD